MRDYPGCEDCLYWDRLGGVTEDGESIGRCHAYSDKEVIRIDVDLSVPGTILPAEAKSMTAEIEAKTPASHGCVHHSDLTNEE